MAPEIARLRPVVTMWVPLLALTIGLVTLVWSADRFLSGAASTALNFGVPKLMIGLTVVALGTSAPEILVSFTAALDGNALLAIGNAIGSNIVNIGLVLGITAAVAPLPFTRGVLRQELPWLLAVTFGTVALMFDLELTRLDGALLLAGLVYIMYRLARQVRGGSEELPESMQEELDELPQLTRGQGFFWLLFGLALLLISARVLVWAATEIAVWLGVSQMIIGLTIVAIGTSLPELATTLGAALKGQTDIAIGNVVGSNILNLVAVLSVPALVAAPAFDNVAFWRDCGMMLALTLALALFAYGLGGRAVITRFEGVVILLGWVGYNFVLLQHAVTA
jgi:cation:H+ antiporter